MVPCYPVCHLLPTFVHRGFPPTPPAAPPPRIPFFGFPSTPPVALPPPVRLGTTHGGFPALSTQLCLTLVPPHHEPFGCFKDAPVPLPRLLCCSGPQRCLNSKHQGGNFRCPFGGLELPKVFDCASMPSLELSARDRVLPASDRPEQVPTG